jgi:hypothetical protein
MVGSSAQRWWLWLSLLKDSTPIVDLPSSSQCFFNEFLFIAKVAIIDKKMLKKRIKRVAIIPSNI